MRLHLSPAIKLGNGSLWWTEEADGSNGILGTVAMEQTDKLALKK